MPRFIASNTWRTVGLGLTVNSCNGAEISIRFIVAWLFSGDQTASADYITTERLKHIRSQSKNNSRRDGIGQVSLDVLLPQRQLYPKRRLANHTTRDETSSFDVIQTASNSFGTSHLQPR